MWLQSSDGGGEDRAHLGHEVMYTVDCEVESSEAASEETSPPPVVVLRYNVLLFVTQWDAAVNVKAMRYLIHNFVHAKY